MGVVAKTNVNHSFKTSELADWIGLLRVKKNYFKCQKRKNLLVEAVLNKALAQAETELRLKQQERKLRWQHLKSSWSINSCDKSHIDMDHNVYGELSNSLDAFMSQLKCINMHIQR